TAAFGRTASHHGRRPRIGTPTAPTIDADAGRQDRRSAQDRNLQRPNPWRSSAKNIALRAHRRSRRRVRADLGRVGLGGGDRAGLYGNRSQLATLPSLAGPESVSLSSSTE